MNGADCAGAPAGRGLQTAIVPVAVPPEQCPAPRDAELVATAPVPPGTSASVASTRDPAERAPAAAGHLILGGALADPIDAAVLLFAAESPKVAEDYANADPYVAQGLVKRWYVREWATVVGVAPSQPARPAFPA